MGLPKINISFFTNLKPRSRRDPAGVVALILKDEKMDSGLFTYKGISKESKGIGEAEIEKDFVIEDQEWEEKNSKYIEQAFKGGPREVIVSVIKGEENYQNGLEQLKNVRFDYLAAPEIAETEEIADWIKKKRKEDGKIFKAILSNHAANHESVINFTADEIVVGESTYTSAEYTPRIAGILAGLPFSRSSTYYVLDEVEAVKEIDNPDAAVDAGELIFINDGKNIKIGRGVNSLVTIQEDEKKNDEFKSIRVVEIMDIIKSEIHDNFNENYIGKVPNTYDNQVLFLSEVNRGFNELAGLDLLDPNAENTSWIDVDAQREAWELAGKDTTDWDEQTVKENSYKRNVYLAGKIKVVDTIEDLDFNIEI